jgi:hypothetical protein
MQQLERDDAIELRIVDFEHNPGSAFAELPADDVATERRTTRMAKHAGLDARAMDPLGESLCVVHVSAIRPSRM